jgi:hypothetical protein
LPDYFHSTVLFLRNVRDCNGLPEPAEVLSAQEEGLSALSDDGMPAPSDCHRDCLAVSFLPAAVKGRIGFHLCTGRCLVGLLPGSHGSGASGGEENNINFRTGDLK